MIDTYVKMQPYYSVPKGVQATQYVMRQMAPKEVWPPMAFAASVASWYEHLSRTVSLVLCKNHHLLEFLTKLLTRNRYLPTQSSTTRQA